jgi:hypothetical protein
MSLSLSCTDDYDLDYFVNGKAVIPWYSVLMFKLAVPFYIPAILLSVLTLAHDKNTITKNKSEISGKINCMSSEELHFS